VQRIVVVGNSGSGKSTLAARIAERIGAPHVELDSIRHQANWVELPDESFVAEVEERTRGGRWVVDGNYPMVREVVWPRADTVVWLDPPRSVVMKRVLLRTLRRLVLRVELWNGNRERWTNLTSTDPERSVVAWAWAEHEHYRATYQRLMREHQDLRFERIVTPKDAEQLLRSLR
jgi:adenylate kinase family enzyme